MRMRSYDPSLSAHPGMRMPAGCGVMRRAKGSKIQNHVMNISFPSGRMDWYTELMALSKKDAVTMATTLILAFEGLLEKMLSGCADGILIRVVHLCTGDAV
eukprot:4663202-Pyramimonas_sp.AAC.1